MASRTGRQPARSHASRSAQSSEGAGAHAEPSSLEPLEARGSAGQAAGTAIGVIQEELTRLGRAVGTLQMSVDEALRLLRPRTDDRAARALATRASAVAIANPADAPTVEVGSPSERLDLLLRHPQGQAEDALPPPSVVTPDDRGGSLTVTSARLLDEATPALPQGLRLGVPMLMLIAVVVGLVVGGVAIAVAMVGWSQLRSGLHTGVAGAMSAPVSSLPGVVEHLLAVVHPPVGPS